MKGKYKHIKKYKVAVINISWRIQDFLKAFGL